MNDGGRGAEGFQKNNIDIKYFVPGSTKSISSKEDKFDKRKYNS
jgi:hypothetical protein